MIERIPQYIKGYVKIKLISPMPERFLSLCVHNRIPVWNLISKQSEYEFEMELSVRDFFRLNNFRRKTHSKIILLEKHGLPFFFQRNQKRKAFFLGILFFILLLYGVSLHIWEIQLQGNHQYSDETIRESLLSLNISDGILKKKIDCSQIAAHIRQQFPDIVWVAARIDGTCLVIQVKENEDSYREASKENDHLDSWDLTAQKDGVVRSIITRTGTPLVQAGQICKKGDILVTGQIEILNNDAQVQRYEYVKADADIMMETTYAYYHEFPLKHQEKHYTGEEKNYYAIRILERNFSLGSPSEKSKDIYHFSYPLYLTDSFRLPVSFEKIQTFPYTLTEEIYTKKEAITIEEEHIRIFLENLVKNNIQVLGQNIQITVTQTTCMAKGTVTACEPCIVKTAVTKEQIQPPENNLQ